MAGRNSDTRVTNLDRDLAAAPVGPAGRCAKHHFALTGEFHRIGNQMPHQLPQSQGISNHRLRKVPIEGVPQLQALRFSLEGELGYNALQRLAKWILLFFQVDVVGGKRGVFQSGIEDLEQVLRAKPRSINVFFLLLGERSFQQQIGHAEDAAQRSSYFVVEAREKLPLQFAKLVGFQHDTLISTSATGAVSLGELRFLGSYADVSRGQWGLSGEMAP